MSDLFLIRVAKQIVARRFGPEKEVKQDMIGSFIRHGLTQREAEIELVLQMYGILFSMHFDCNPAEP
jgi:hypothetical protein